MDPTLMQRDVALRVERAWAHRERDFTDHITRHHPGWGGRTFELAGGFGVLAGRGLFVNRALGIALDRPIVADDLGTLEAHSAAVGVPAAIETGPHADPSLFTLAAARGYHLASQRSVFALRLDQLRDPALAPVAIEVVSGDAAALADWQAVARAAFGCHDGVLAAASDTYIATTHAIGDAVGLIARDPVDGRALGSAMVALRDGLATLGAMGTIPEARGRGVQRALVDQRLRIAAEHGCELAVTSARAASISERNLARSGFSWIMTQVTLERPAVTGPGAP